MVVECKLTNAEEAWAKLRGVYLPVVGMALRCRVWPVVVVKWTRPGQLIATTLKEALALPQELNPVLHWIGKGPIL